MKFESLFLLIIGLTNVSYLVNINPASAQRSRSCTASNCPVYTNLGTVRGGGTLPAYLLQQLNDLIGQGNFPEAERRLVQFSQQAETTQDIGGQAAAHEALGDLYTRMNKPDLASSHLINADALYQRLGNSQRSNEVRVQLQQVQLQQIQLRQIQLRQR